MSLLFEARAQRRNTVLTMSLSGFLGQGGLDVDLYFGGLMTVHMVAYYEKWRCR